MKKILNIALILILLFILSSCIKENKNMFFKDKDKIYSEKVITEILNVIEHKDREKFISLFSKRAQESENFINNINLFINEFNDSNLRFDEESSTIVKETTDYGITTKKVIDTYKVSGNNNKYIFFFIIWAKDDTSKDNEGLYTLRIIKESDYNEQYYNHDQMEIPGVYYNPTN